MKVVVGRFAVAVAVLGVVVAAVGAFVAPNTIAVFGAVAVVLALHPAGVAVLIPVGFAVAALFRTTAFRTAGRAVSRVVDGLFAAIVRAAAIVSTAAFVRVAAILFAAASRGNRPPGLRLQGLAEYFFPQKAYKTIFEPILRDLQDEHTEALAEGRIWKARWVGLRGRFSFWAAVIDYLSDFVGKLATFR